MLSINFFLHDSVYSIDTDWVIIMAIKILGFGIFYSKVMSINSLLNQDPKHKDAQENTRKRLHIRVYPPRPVTNHQALVEIKNLDNNTHEPPFFLETSGSYSAVAFRGLNNSLFKPAFATNNVQYSDNNNYLFVPAIISRGDTNIEYLTGLVSYPEPVLFTIINGQQYMKLKKQDSAIRMRE